MLHNLTGWHALILLVIVVLLFGSAKLPALAKSLGQSARILKKEAAAGREPDAGAADASAAPTPVAASVASADPAAAPRDSHP